MSRSYPRNSAAVRSTVVSLSRAARRGAARKATRNAIEEALLTKLRFEVEEGGKPSATITIPLWLAKSAAKLCSKAAGKDLTDRIDIDEILKAASDPEAKGVILEIVDHQGGDKVTISVTP